MIVLCILWTAIVWTLWVDSKSYRSGVTDTLYYVDRNRLFSTANGRDVNDSSKL